MRRIRFCHISITSPSGSAKPPTVYRKTSPAHTSRSIVSEKAEFVNEPRKPPESGGFFLQFWKTCAIVNMVLPINGKRAAPHRVLRRDTASFALRHIERGASTMVTYTDLIQLGILIVGIISLFIQANNKKK